MLHLFVREIMRMSLMIGENFSWKSKTMIFLMKAKLSLIRQTWSIRGCCIEIGMRRIIRQGKNINLSIHNWLNLLMLDESFFIKFLQDL